MPAIVDRSPLIVAIGSGGNSPTLVRRVRAQLETLLPQSIGQLASAAGRWRERVQSALPDVPTRRRFWDRYFDSAAATLSAAVTAATLDARITAALAVAASAGLPRGEVWLIGAGPGDADLLTLRALQLLQQCDVVLYDRLIGTEVLGRVRRDAERVYVGKQTGQHRTTQTRINELMIQYAQRGLRVARLKGGDPFVFGRGGEELAALAAVGIPVTVVPGVTAALGAAALAGIPLTHRGVSQSVSFVTAMAEATELLDWRSLATPLQTVVFYMGVAQLPRIVEQLLAHGVDAARGAAIVERATLPGQRVLRGTLATIAGQASAARVSAPALLIVGDVVHQAQTRHEL
jgi:uroporphyrin-III C-methyltransferase / precorrin-2 dehydrogenase / sirohydrochlorin ferrochelatase